MRIPVIAAVLLAAAGTAAALSAQPIRIGTITDRRIKPGQVRELTPEIVIASTLKGASQCFKPVDEFRLFF